ncbi:MAG: hypothetical protein HY815_02155 [Candidatus Riflebacteria bacterium]|nr:hypothetical protein [Candidatus Riflebacteria bacterium]
MEGYVGCRCYWQKKAKPHPHPQALNDRTPGILELDPKASEKVREAHDDWLFDACPHEFMQLASEELGQAGDLELLATAISHVSGRTPSLHRWAGAPPSTSVWSPEHASLVKAEIDWLRTPEFSFEALTVEDGQTREILYETVQERVYCYCGDGSRLGVGPGGMWLDRQGRSVFVTRELAQEELPDGTYRLTPEGGEPLISSAAFLPYDAENPDRRRATPARARFVARSRSSGALEGILGALDRLVKASKRTGHPVIWAV